MGERLAFLPSIGACGLIGRALVLGSSKLKAGYALPALCIALFITRSTMRIPVWQDNGVLFEQTVLDAPQSPKAHYNLGVHHVLTTHDRKRARLEFERAVEIHPDYVLALRALADLAAQRKDWPLVASYYRRLLEITPEDSLVRNNLLTLEQFMKEHQ